jgi:AcrR family transcriptional regulator
MKGPSPDRPGPRRKGEHQEAASVLFAQKGYEATTIAQISEGVEISHVTFFRYFRRRAHIILGRDNAIAGALAPGTGVGRG